MNLSSLCPSRDKVREYRRMVSKILLEEGGGSMDFIGKVQNKLSGQNIFFLNKFIFSIPLLANIREDVRPYVDNCWDWSELIFSLEAEKIISRKRIFRKFVHIVKASPVVCPV